MLQIIGLIVAIYAMARIVQIPLEMTARHDDFMGVPFMTRFFVVAGISVLALGFLGLLTLALLFSGSPSPNF